MAKSRTERLRVGLPQQSLMFRTEREWLLRKDKNLFELEEGLWMESPSWG